MNIDIVNRQVSKQHNINERKVAQVNKFYWRHIYDYFYGYDTRALSIENICLFYNDKKLIKKTILLYIKRIRNVRMSVKFKISSPSRLMYIRAYQEIIKKLWNVRKQCKYTN